MRAFQPVLFLALFFIIITVLVVFAPAQAAERPGYFSDGTLFGEGTAATDYTIPPYLKETYIPNMAAIEAEDWTPLRWGLKAEGNGEGLVHRFMRSGLITEQDVKDSVPVLEVSDLFLRLSDRDKRKVLMSIDHIYQITAQQNPGFFVVEHDPTDEIIATYGQAGMQVQ